MKHYDVCVIGAGSAGLVAATTANRLKAKTALIENRKIGGECLHTGCIPSKTFISSSKIYHQLKNTQQYGLPEFTPSKQFDFSSVMDKVQSVVDSIYKHENKSVFENMGIDVHFGETAFLSSHELKVGKVIISTDHFIICTGSSPQIPLVPGLDIIQPMTNENFWLLRKQPKTIFFMGAGPIACELGQSMNRFGSEVYLSLRSERILKKEDPEISSELQKILENEGIKILNKCSVKLFEENSDNSITVHFEREGQDQKLIVDAVFAAVGRIPNVQSLKPEKAGVEYSNKGIKIDEYLQTSASHIYACGDAASPYKFTHVAAAQADIAVNNILREKKRSFDQFYVPWVTFTEPEVAHVGLTEEEAKEKFNDIKVLRVNCDLDRFRTEMKTEGFIKVTLNGKDSIVGASAIGAHSGEYIQNFTLAMQHGLTVRQIAETIYPYPTFSEVVKKAFQRYLRTKG